MHTFRWLLPPPSVWLPPLRLLTTSDELLPIVRYPTSPSTHTASASAVRTRSSPRQAPRSFCPNELPSHILNLSILRSARGEYSASALYEVTLYARYYRLLTALGTRFGAAVEESDSKVGPLPFAWCEAFCRASCLHPTAPQVTFVWRDAFKNSDKVASSSFQVLFRSSDDTAKWK